MNPTLRSVLTPLLTSCLAIWVASAHAEKMYQWVDAQTGTVQLAGKPPPWFLNPQSGPRVRVYEGGSVIADTAYPPAPNTAPDITAQTAPESDATASEREPVDRSVTQVNAFKALLETWDREQAVRAQQVRPPRANSSAAESPVPPPPPH